MQPWIPYCGAAPLPSEWLARWNLDPVLLAVLLLCALVLAGSRTSATGPKGDLFAALGLAALLFVSPFCALGSALFIVRTLHHVVLVTAFAALLSRLPLLGRVSVHVPLSALTGIQVVIFWAWHAPPLYSLALSHDALFWAMQASMAGSAALWWSKVRAIIGRGEAGAAVIALLATMVLTGMLGALITFAGRALYAPHWLTTQGWGLSPLEDQQIAGIIMWAPASAIYLIAACVILYRSLGLGAAERTAR